MNDVLMAAIISGVFAMLGTLGGIIASSKLTCWRIEQLEKKVDKHNTLIERTYVLETDVKILKEKAK